MDNRINEIRRKISMLRAEMAELEAAVRDQLNRDLDCSGSALQLLDLRRQMTRLIGEWKAAGGSDLLPNIRERVGIRAARTNNRAARAVSRR